MSEARQTELLVTIAAALVTVVALLEDIKTNTAPAE